MKIFREFTFEAAHRLPLVADGHKCARVHGHSYRFEVHVDGPVDPATGMVMDFGTIKAAVAPIVDVLDHHWLNDVAGLTNPTSENLAVWLWDRLAPVLSVSEIVVRETASTAVSYTGPASHA